MLQRWLDPPAVTERKRQVRAPRGRGHSGDDRQLEIGCLVPLALVLAVLVGAGVISRLGLRAAAPTRPAHIAARVIESGATHGTPVLATTSGPRR